MLTSLHEKHNVAILVTVICSQVESLDNEQEQSMGMQLYTFTKYKPFNLTRFSTTRKWCSPFLYKCGSQKFDNCFTWIPRCGSNFKSSAASGVFSVTLI